MPKDKKNQRAETSGSSAPRTPRTQMSPAANRSFARGCFRVESSPTVNARIAADAGASSASKDGGIGRIIGAQLTSIQFVLDYLILRFDEEGALTTLVWPELHKSGNVIFFGESDYRSELCALMKRRVAQAGIDDEETIMIAFGSDASLHLRARGIADLKQVAQLLRRLAMTMSYET